MSNTEGSDLAKQKKNFINNSYGKMYVLLRREGINC